MRCIWLAGWGELESVFDDAIRAADLRRESLVRCSLDYFREGENPCDGEFSRPASRLAEEIAAGPEPIVLIGWSLGGNLALEAATLAPKHVSAIVLVSTLARFTDPDGDGSMTGAASLHAFQQSLHSDPAAALRSFYRRSSKSFRHDDDYVRNVLRRFTFRLDPGLEYLRHKDCSRFMKAANVPLVRLHGTADKIAPCPAEGSEPAFQFEQAGHNLPQERGRELGVLVRMLYEARTALEKEILLAAS